jgi:hypothetical protein
MYEFKQQRIILCCGLAVSTLGIIIAMAELICQGKGK